MQNFGLVSFGLVLGGVQGVETSTREVLTVLELALQT